MRELKFSDGLEEYRLNDRVTVRFNPTDVGFLEKLSHTFEQLDLLQDEVRKSRDSITDDREVFPIVRELDAKMRGVINELFGDDVCTPLFGSVNLFASSGGLPLWANLLLAITDEVQSAMKGELAAARSVSPNTWRSTKPPDVFFTIHSRNCRPELPGPHRLLCHP